MTNIDADVAVRDLLNEFRATRSALTRQGDQLLSALLEADLRSLNGYRLKKLKLQLRKFNCVTQHWS